MKAAIISFPGSNCDRDCMDAARRAYGVEPTFVFHKDATLPPCDVIFVAGGFSYGDYLRAGAMAARSAIMDEVARAAERGVAVAGICNGFQILCEAGLLPGALVRNAERKFVCRNENLTVETASSPFTMGYARGQTVRFVTSHHDGCYLADAATLDRLEGEDRVAFRYQDNPNGSARNIAGVLSANRRVLGLMPHPDRAVDPMTAGGADGLAFFTGVAQAMAA